jgi:hypothetical protein
VGAVVTTDYETTAWLRFNHPSVKVVQMHEEQRYLWAPAGTAALLKGGRLYYLAQDRRDRHRSLEPFFASVGFPNELQAPAAVYRLYRLGQPKSSTFGKMP